MKHRIVRIPPCGFARPRNNSKKALKYLLWIEKERRIHIKTALNGKEVNIHGIGPVDGTFHNQKTGKTEIFEIMGCYFHR